MYKLHKAILVASMIGAGVGMGALAGSVAAEDIANDMVNSGSLNLISYTNTDVDSYSSAADGAQKYQRGVSASIPYAVLDDSLSIYTSDSLGIIDENNTDVFFGITDTVNPDNPDSEVMAQWVFDISDAAILAVSIDMGAMGDFEASDTFVWTASIDGGVEQALFTGVADEASSHTYTLSGGNTFTLNDPMTVNGEVLSNVLQTFSANVEGTGSLLTLTLSAGTNGGSEAFAFQNIRITEGRVLDPETPPVPLVKIHEIQGNGAATPMAGDTVMVEAVVVGDFQNNGGSDNGDLQGFYVQEEDADADADALTSEGLFIFDRNGDIDVSIGDRVLITGVVSEYSGMTEISLQNIEVVESGVMLPVLSELSLPVSSLGDFEPYEGMRVRFPQPLVISEYYNFDRYGEIVLAQPLNGEPRPMTPTAMEVPGSAAYQARLEANLLSRITLDDGRSSQNPDPAIHPNGNVFDLSNRFRGGDLVQNATGVLDYRFGLYRLQPTQGAGYIASNPRPELPYVAGRLKVASFNVLNYFNTLDEGDFICGPSGDMECRGADNAEEFQRQRDKIISAIAAMDADIVGLIEIENNTSASLADLVDGLNTYLGYPAYAYVDTGSIGTDAIKVGFIYQPRHVQPKGDFAVLDSSVDPDFIDTKNRPALAQTFKERRSHSRVTVVVNHFKSKGSDCNDIGDPDAGDGQGNCNGTRILAAQALAGWLDGDPTGTGMGDVLIIGDLNSYDKEDPLATLQAAGYRDLIREYQGETAYSYVFDGQYGYLDYALANASLARHISGVAVWHINADEPDILDYDTSFKQDAQDALYEANPYRSSDHDPVIVGLDLGLPRGCHVVYSHSRDGYRKHSGRDDLIKCPPQGGPGSDEHR